jgi:hypothetical protein
MATKLESGLRINVNRAPKTTKLKKYEAINTVT